MIIVDELVAQSIDNIGVIDNPICLTQRRGSEFLRKLT